MPCSELIFEHVPSLRSNGVAYEAVRVTPSNANDFLGYTGLSTKATPDKDVFATLTRCLVEAGTPAWVATAKRSPRVRKDSSGFARNSRAILGSTAGAGQGRCYL
jgi:hypothetical protein